MTTLYHLDLMKKWTLILLTFHRLECRNKLVILTTLVVKQM